MSGSENIYKPSARVDLDWYKRDAKMWQSAGNAGNSADFKKKDADLNCEKNLGEPFENEVKNTSPNATNLSR